MPVATLLKPVETDIIQMPSLPHSPPVAIEPMPTPKSVLAKVSRLKLPEGRALFDATWPPAIGILGFLALWALLAPMVHTSLGALPGPGEVWTQFVALMREHSEARGEAEAVVAAGGVWSGAPTFVDQIFTSLKTVALGFILARSTRSSRSCARSARSPGCRS
jgi:nitrate/nitrite transport system permease protein